MGKNMRCYLQARKCSIEKQLAELIQTTPRSTSARSLERELKIVNELASFYPAVGRPRWITLASCATLILVTLGVGFAVRLPTILMEVDATVDEFSLAFGPGNVATTGEIPLDGAGVCGTKLSIDGAVAKTISCQDLVAAEILSGFYVQPMTKLELAVRSANCYRLTIKAGGLDSSLVQSAPLGRNGTPVKLLHLGPDSDLRFCSTKGISLAFSNVNSLIIASLSRENPPPALYSSSIQSGSLKINATSRERKLLNGEKLSLQNIDDGHLLLRPSDKFRLVFEGDVANPTIFGVSSDFLFVGENLKPNLVHYVQASPVIASLVGAFTGLVGVFFGLLKRWRDK